MSPAPASKPKLKLKLKSPRPLDRAAYLAYFDAWLASDANDQKMSATVFGAAAVGEPAFMTFLRKGVRKVEYETLERAVAFCKSYGKYAGAKRRRVAPTNTVSAAGAECGAARPSE